MNWNKVQGMIERQMLPGETVAHQTLVDTSQGVWFALVLTDQAVYWFPSAGPRFSVTDARRVARLPLATIAEVTLSPQPALSKLLIIGAFALAGGLLSFWMWKSMDAPVGLSLACTGGIMLLGGAISLFTGKGNPAIRRLCLTTSDKTVHCFDPYAVARSATPELQQQCVDAQETAYTALQNAGLSRSQCQSK